MTCNGYGMSILSIRNIDTIAAYRCLSLNVMYMVYTKTNWCINFQRKTQNSLMLEIYPRWKGFQRLSRYSNLPTYPCPPLQINFVIPLVPFLQSQTFAEKYLSVAHELKKKWPFWRPNSLFQKKVVWIRSSFSVQFCVVMSPTCGTLLLLVHTISSS